MKRPVQISLTEVIRNDRVIYEHIGARHAQIFIQNCVAWFGRDWLKGVSVDDGFEPVSADLWLADRSLDGQGVV